MPLYDSVLWDFSNADLMLFYSRWQVCVKRSVIHAMVIYCTGLLTIYTFNLQMFSIFIKFLKYLYTTNNNCISLCAHLATEGSGTSDSNNSIK